jgi:hypothetical protein
MMPPKAQGSRLSTGSPLIDPALQTAHDRTDALMTLVTEPITTLQFDSTDRFDL